MTINMIRDQVFICVVETIMKCLYIKLQGEVAGPLLIGADGTAATYATLPPVLSELVKSHPLL